MSSTFNVNQLLQDARKLSNRLRDHDANADQVISHAQSVLTEVQAMKEYQDDLEQLNSIANDTSRAKLVKGT